MVTRSRVVASSSSTVLLAATTCYWADSTVLLAATTCYRRNYVSLRVTPCHSLSLLVTTCYYYEGDAHLAVRDDADLGAAISLLRDDEPRRPLGVAEERHRLVRVRARVRVGVRVGARVRTRARARVRVREGPSWHRELVRQVMEAARSTLAVSSKRKQSSK